MYIPTTSPEFMMLEEVWNISKRHLLVMKQYPSFEDFKEKKTYCCKDTDNG